MSAEEGAAAAVAALHRALMWREAAASVALDRDEHVRTISVDECFNARCGFDDVHEHGEACTTDCDCGRGAVDIDGVW